MKCIHCGKDCKLRERPDKKCPSCRHPFAFEPRGSDPLADGAFQAAIDAVSSKGQVRWGVEHLYYEVCRRVNNKRVSSGCAISVVGGLLAAAVIVPLVAMQLKLQAFVFVAIILGMFAIFSAIGFAAAGTRSKTTVVLELSAFNKLWERWQSIHGAPKGLIVRKPITGKSQPVEPDLKDYSFDRAVICDRARTVDLLLANNFHFENNCAVLSVEGYPSGPFETVRAMLRRNPKLQVFALHDATLAGCTLARRLANDPDWFKGQVPVVDVGLRPHHAPRHAGLWYPGGTVAAQRDPGLTTEEDNWLAKYSLELAVIRPEQVLKRLFRAINHQSEIQTNESDSGVIISSDGGSSNGDSMDTDAGDHDGGFDSFG